MSLYAVWLLLANDVPSAITTTACSVAAANPDLWSSPSLVPSYAYQSLGQILVGSTCSSGELGLHIVYKEGEALENSLSEITLIGTPFESTELPREGLDSNEIGAETLKLEIAVRLPEESQNWQRITNAELRIRYLLDQSWRKKRRNTTPFIPNLGDNSVTGQIICTYCEYAAAPNAKEIFSRYILAYTRAVPR